MYHLLHPTRYISYFSLLNHPYPPISKPVPSISFYRYCKKPDNISPPIWLFLLPIHTLYLHPVYHPLHNSILIPFSNFALYLSPLETQSIII